MTNETKTAVYDLGRTFEAFKETHDRRLREIEQRGSADPLTEMKVNRLNAEISRAIDAAQEAKRHVIGYRGGKRFVKVTATPVSLETGGPVAMLALKGQLSQKPQDNS